MASERSATQSNIKNDQTGSNGFRRLLSQLSIDFQEILQTLFCKKITNSPASFVKIYSILQKLEHLPCNTILELV